MYQSIDTEEEARADAEAAAALGSTSVGPWVWASLGVAFLTLVMVTWMSLSGPGAPVAESEPGASSRGLYLRAVGEPSPALRRARLRDFVDAQPRSPRRDAARAQLEVLDAAEASDWAAVTDAVYDRRQTSTERLAALDRFEARWGKDVLGARGEEIARLREDADTANRAGAPEDAVPEFSPLPSPIPDSIQGERMAGEARRTLSPPLYVPPAPPPPARRAVETPPEVRRNRTPSYPSAAQRRGIGALVEVEMDIDARGRVDAVRVVRVEAERFGKDFARAAERAARRTRFNPRTLDGEPVSTRGVRKRYRFQP